jgi:hypothetical protein
MNRFISVKLLDEEPDLIHWKLKELQYLDTLMKALIICLEKPFHIFVTVDKGTA